MIARYKWNFEICTLSASNPVYLWLFNRSWISERVWVNRCTHFKCRLDFSQRYVCRDQLHWNERSH